MPTLRERFRGCLLGAAVGDVVGAAVEAESAAYIAKTFRSIEEILATETVEEFTGPPWRVGRFTDDTQMMICVAEWLLADEADPADAPQRLLARFADAYEPWRRYGPGTAGILRLFEAHRDNWRELATSMFPEGSQGNGGAMRVAPVGLAYFRDTKKAAAALWGSWVTITIVLSKSLFSFCSSVRTSRALWASRFPVGSSARMMSGSVTIARAMATRCS